MLIPIVFGLLTALAWGVGDFLSRKPSREVGSFLTTVYTQPIGLLILLIYAASVGQLNFIPALLNPAYLLATFGVGLVALASLYFLIRGYTVGAMSVVAPLAGSYPAVTFFLSVIFLGVFVSFATTVAIAVTIIGIILAGLRVSEILAFLKRRNLTASSLIDKVRPASPIREVDSTSDGIVSETDVRKRWIEGADSGIVACLCGGTAMFGLGFVTPVLGSVMPALLIKFIGTITGFSISAPLKQRFKRPSRNAFSLLAVMATLDAIGFLLLSQAISIAGIDLPIVVTLSGLLSVVTSTLATVFYKERMEKIQALGIILIVVGVSTIVYF